MKFSTIGTSWITELFIKAAKKAGIQLVSVYSRSNKKAHAFAQTHHAQHAYTDLLDMLTDDSDFIYIASPNSFHYDHILQCIAHGKHVFCEKPLVINEAQWEDVQQKAQKAGVFVFEGYRHLFTPNYRVIKQSLGELGQIRSVLLPFGQYSSRYDAFKRGEEPNVFTKTFAGGVLMDLGVYPLSMAIDLFGEPEDIHYYPVLLENGVDGSGTLILVYDAFIVTIMCSKITHANAPAEIHGEDGTLTMDHLADTTSVSLYNRKEKQTTDLSKPMVEPDMIYELNAFIDMIKEDNRTLHDQWLERSRLVVKWSERARQSVGIVFPDQ